MVKDQTILTPSSLFLIFLALFYVITALLHPQEIGLVFYGFIYIICIPSAYLLLSIYSMVNMNNVSWGTRETAPAARDEAASPTKAEKGTARCRLLPWSNAHSLGAMKYYRHSFTHIPNMKLLRIKW